MTYHGLTPDDLPYNDADEWRASLYYGSTVDAHEEYLADSARDAIADALEEADR